MRRSRLLTALLTTTLAAVALESAQAQTSPKSGISAGQQSIIQPATHEQGPALLAPGAEIPAEQPALFQAAPYHKPITQSRNTAPVYPVSQPVAVQPAPAYPGVPRQPAQPIPPVHGPHPSTYGYGYPYPNGNTYPYLNAPMSPTPRPDIPYQVGGTIITNQAFGPHEMLWKHKYKAMYPPFYYRVKGGWYLSPSGVRSYEYWKLEGTEVNVKYHSHVPWTALFHPPVSH